MSAVAARRLVAAGVAALAVVAGLLVALALPDNAATDIAGDALYVVVAWGAVAFLAPRWSSVAVGAATFAWCAAVELFQLTGLPEAWGATFWPLMLVFGTVFDARDLVIYAVASVALVLLDRAGRRVAPRRGDAASARAVPSGLRGRRR